MSCENTPHSNPLLPVLLLSFAFMVFLGFQVWMLAADRDSLNEAYTQQDKILEQIEKVKVQVNALAQGTLKLAQQGDKNAQGIIEGLKKAGVNIQEAAPQGEPQPGDTMVNHAPAAPPSAK